MSSQCLHSVPFGSIIAFILTTTGCFFFAVYFEAAMENFSMQFNTLAPIGSFAFQSQITAITIVVVIFSVIFFVIGTFSTNVLAHHAVRRGLMDESHSSLKRFVSSPSFLAVSTVTTLSFVIIWALMVSVCAVFMSFYMIFIGAVYSFCALIDQQCFDFTVLLPALINKLTSKKVNLTFCKDKKETLCLQKNNQIWPFFTSFFCSIVALVGLGYFLICMAANYTRLRSEKRLRKGDHFAINHGTVDSNSFVMANMNK